jgi:hypothetical protein
MCMFCAALPMVVGATAVAQGEQRKRLSTASSKLLDSQSTESKRSMPFHHLGQPVEMLNEIQPRRKGFVLSPMRINQIGALAFVTLLIASGLYHTHMPS